jgi:hypothetical protein
MVNKQLRDARGVSVDVPIGVPKTSEKMGEFIRKVTGRTDGKDNPKAIMARRRAAVEKGFILAADGETILHDFRTDKEKEAQSVD